MARRLVLRTRHWPVFGPLYRLYYRLAARLAALGLRAAIGRRLEALYLRRGLIGDSWEPGVSDIDLLAVLTPDAEDPALLRRLWSAYRSLKKPFPMLGELQVCSRAQLARFARHGGLRAAEMGGWRPLLGAAPPETTAGGPEACLQEAAFSYLALLHSYFEWRAGRDSERYKMAKAFLDAVRCARAAECGRAVPDSRLQEIVVLRLRNEAALIDAVEKPELLDAELAFKLVHVAFGVLDAVCAPTAPGAAAVAPARAEDVGEGIWARRLHALTAPGLPRPAGVFWDSLFRWYVVLDRPPEPLALRLLLEQMETWRRGEAPVAIPQPGWLVSYGILQALALSPHLETPFFHRTLGLEATAFWRRPASGSALWKDQVRWRWNVDLARLAPPQPEAQRALARQTAAEFSLSLPLFTAEAWSGANAYRLFYLYSRVLPLALYARTAAPCDPHDIDAVLAAYAAAFPEDASEISRLREETLTQSAATLDARDPAQLFYEHEAFLARVLARAQRELD